MTPSLRRLAPRWIHIHPDGLSCQSVLSKAVPVQFMLVDISFYLEKGLHSIHECVADADVQVDVQDANYENGNAFNCSDTDDRKHDRKKKLMPTHPKVGLRLW